MIHKQVNDGQLRKLMIIHHFRGWYFYSNKWGETLILSKRKYIKLRGRLYLRLITNHTVEPFSWENTLGGDIGLLIETL